MKFLTRATRVFACLPHNRYSNPSRTQSRDSTTTTQSSGAQSRSSSSQHNIDWGVSVPNVSKLRERVVGAVVNTVFRGHGGALPAHRSTPTNVGGGGANDDAYEDEDDDLDDSFLLGERDA
jgi:hypothetical protein